MTGPEPPPATPSEAIARGMCPGCMGTGLVVRLWIPPSPGDDGDEGPCSTCGGTGTWPPPPPRPAARLVGIDLTGGREPGTWIVRVLIEIDGAEHRVIYELSSEQAARDMLTLAERAPFAVAMHAADLLRQ